MKIVFEAATIQDAVTKASRVAPTTGESFDKANGLVITASDGQVSIRATDTLTYYHEIIDTVSVEGDGEWKIPSRLAGDLFSRLKIGSGIHVTMEQEGNLIRVRSRSTRATFRMQDAAHYPSWDPFDPSDLSPISSLGERIDMVQWAAETGIQPPLSAIYLNGTHIMATNRICLAIAPCLAPEFQEGFMIPKSAFAPISGVLRETQIGIDGSHMLLMPDSSTQIKCVTFAGEYPPVSRIMHRDHPEHLNLSSTELAEAIERAMVFAGNNRTPVMQLIVGLSELAIYMKDEEQQSLGEVIDCPGEAVHDRVVLEFTPKNVLNAVRSAPNEGIKIGYDPTNARKALHIDGGSGYEVWIAARRDVKGETE